MVTGACLRRRMVTGATYRTSPRSPDGYRRMFETPDGYRRDLPYRIMEASRSMQTVATTDSGKKALEWRLNPKRRMVTGAT
jgi:hypothetical protein